MNGFDLRIAYSTPNEVSTIFAVICWVHRTVFIRYTVFAKQLLNMSYMWPWVCIHEFFPSAAINALGIFLKTNTVATASFSITHVTWLKIPMVQWLHSPGWWFGMQSFKFINLSPLSFWIYLRKQSIFAFFAILQNLDDAELLKENVNHTESEPWLLITEQHEEPGHQ